MKCPICEDDMERGDFDHELYAFCKNDKKIKVTRPAAVYECICVEHVGCGYAAGV